MDDYGVKNCTKQHLELGALLKKIRSEFGVYPDNYIQAVRHEDIANMPKAFSLQFKSFFRSTKEAASLSWI